MEGLFLVGVLGGTMFVSLIPAFWYMITPAPSDHDH